MKNVIITGGTGMIGSLVLEACLNRVDVANVTSIVRKATGRKHPKLVEVVHDDFLDFSAIKSHLRKQDVCFYCIGVYTGQVPTEEFKVITVDYTKAFAEALKKESPDAAFCFLSGRGADSSEKSAILFAREKGIAENILLGLNFPRVHFFRPGYIYPVTPRTEPNLGYKVMRVLYKIIAPIVPRTGVPSTKLAQKMVSVGLEGGDKIYYEHRDIFV